MKIDIFVGIDPGQTEMGLCAFSPSRNVVSMHKPKPKKGTIPLVGVDRLSFLMYEIKMWLDELNRLGTVQQICLEGYANGAKYGREASGETRATILLALVGWYGLNDPTAYPSIVSPGELKKFVTGNGNAKKELMLLEVYKRWGLSLTDHNLADAYGLARVADALYSGSAVTKFQQDIIDKLRKHTQWNPALHLDLQTEMVTTFSSKSAPPQTPHQLQESSPTQSTKAGKSGSGPSGRVRLIRRSKPAP